MSVNVNGIREPRKVLARGEYVVRLEPQSDIWTLVETHLFEHSGKTSHSVAHESRRKAEDVKRVCDSVTILVKKGLHCIMTDDLPELGRQLNVCSIQIPLNDSRVGELGVTGVFPQPAAKRRFTRSNSRK